MNSATGCEPVLFLGTPFTPGGLDQTAHIFVVFQFWGCERSGSGGNIINPIASARLRTANHFGFTYGKVEARAKLPAGSKM